MKNTKKIFILITIILIISGVYFLLKNNNETISETKNVSSTDITEYSEEFMQEYLNHSQYALLLKNLIYNHKMYIFLKKEYEDLYTCPYCSTRTMTIEYKCARCFNVFSDRHFLGYVNCGYCGEEMVICDAVNIE